MERKHREGREGRLILVSPSVWLCPLPAGGREWRWAGQEGPGSPVPVPPSRCRVTSPGCHKGLASAAHRTVGGGEPLPMRGTFS